MLLYHNIPTIPNLQHTNLFPYFVPALGQLTSQRSVLAEDPGYIFLLNVCEYNVQLLQNMGDIS